LAIPHGFTGVWWQVTLCDPIRSSEMGLNEELKRCPEL